MFAILNSALDTVNADVQTNYSRLARKFSPFVCHEILQRSAAIRCLRDSWSDVTLECS